MGTCVKCGDTLPDGAHFCPGCGVPRSVALPPIPDPPEPLEPDEAAFELAAVELAAARPSAPPKVDGWESEPPPGPEHHHLDAAEAAKIAAGTTAKTITWALGIIFTICIVCAVFAVGVLAFTSFGGDVLPGIFFGGALVLGLIGILYAMMRRAGFFSASPAGAAGSGPKPGGPAPRAAHIPTTHSPVVQGLLFPLKALGLFLGAFTLVIVIITYYAMFVALVNGFGGNIIIGIVAATIVLAGIGWLLYTRLDFQGMKR